MITTVLIALFAIIGAHATVEHVKRKGRKIRRQVKRSFGVRTVRYNVRTGRMTVR